MSMAFLSVHYAAEHKQMLRYTHAASSRGSEAVLLTKWWHQLLLKLSVQAALAV